MSKFYKTFSLFLLLILSQYAWAQNDSTNVLFIGNSITYFNNMPQMFRNIANNKGKDVRIASHTPGGTGIVNHYVNPQVYSLIRSRKWDVVILQPGSSESAGASYPVNVTVARAQIILDSIYKNNACTKVYLYEIPYGIPSSGGYPKYFQIQTMIRDSVTKMADALKLQMLPAGESFRAYYSLYQNQLLHGSINDIHPNAFGSYLVASTFYSGIFQDSVSNCTYYSTIPKDTADKFFEIADSVVLKNKSNWRINTYNLHAAFSMMQNIDTISLTNTSSNYQSLLWTFGDGNSSTTSNPTHIYTQNGNYEVKLFVKDANKCLDSSSVEVEVLTIGFNENENEQIALKIYPNPSADYFNIDLPIGSRSIQLFDAQGKQVLYKAVEGNKSSYRFEISDIPTGVYFIFVHGEFGNYSSKLIKK